jgi:tetratricopeptide (TPR) repeat protein
MDTHKDNASTYKEKALLSQNAREKESYWRSAIDEWKAALEESPDDEVVLNELGYGCFYLMNLSASKDQALGRFHEGVGYFDRVLSLDPNFHWSIFGLGMLYFDIAERTKSPVDYLNKAIDYFDEGFEYDADYIWGHMSKAWAYFKIGNATNYNNYYRKALPEFEKVLKIDPDNQLAKDGIRFCNEKL